MPLSKLWAGSLVLLAAVSLPLQAASPVKVGSKIDTEGALLGNIILQVLESHGVPTVNKVQLGTTPVVRGAITSGELDIYPEYTGNGAFFFKDENDAAWKNAAMAYGTDGPVAALGLQTLSDPQGVHLSTRLHQWCVNRC
ncbi:hypothetical protein ESCOCK374M_01730 [Escherichia coli]